jgi:CO/xanthine dehydrogenase FAD-binding subunit
MLTFDYARPSTVAEAIGILHGQDGAARVLCGGTDLLVGLRHHTLTPRVVVDIKGCRDLPAGVGNNGTRLRVGATTVMSRLADDADIHRAFPALVDAMNTVGSIQIRNRATLAGNIANASPAADTVPPMLIYGALVTTAGPGGERRVPLEEFILGPRLTALQPGEIITAVELPLPGGPLGTAFARMTRRRGVDLATVNLACSVDEAGVTRLAYGAAAPRAFTAVDESGTLADPAATAEQKHAVLDRLLLNASPISDVRGSRDYRMAMLRVLSTRAASQAIQRLHRHASHAPES